MYKSTFSIVAPFLNLIHSDSCSKQDCVAPISLGGVTSYSSFPSPNRAKYLKASSRAEEAKRSGYLWSGADGDGRRKTPFETDSFSRWGAYNLFHPFPCNLLYFVLVQLGLCTRPFYALLL